MADHEVELRGKIRRALAEMSGDDFATESRRLLNAIGYNSERTLPDQSGDPGEFFETFPAKNPNTATEQEFLKESSHVRLVFQYTDEEISNADSQRRLFEDTEFYSGNARSFLFIAVELLRDEYPRGRYAQLTREVNKRFPNTPAVVLFRTAAGLLTLAFVHRRLNKVDPERDVLGRVSLVREVEPDDPHRAHLDILAELSLEDRLKWMDSHNKNRNFDGLLAAWLDALDTEELNRRFYRDLFGWFERAVDEARFPTRGAKTLPAEEHVIRLITRLLFIWFIKEKGLVAEDLFVEEQVRPLLKDYDPSAGDSYYRAVLQNLFFATLNTEIGQRRFSRVDNQDHRNFSVYRYRAEMADPDTLIASFAKTPFINGGLFDCMDTEQATGGGGYRIDFFTDKPSQRRGYSIPNRLFFDDGGLITLFNHYKFTVEENTPAETEVALDPELLGKVFENLLAAYNPETKETARKQTGSYYTPRPVVDYMVDEALVASFSNNVQPTDGDAGWWQARLRFLLDYDDAEDAGEFFDENEAEALVRTIAGLRVLDPAAGSGAFPMGVLHKLTLALRRLDDKNLLWEGLQKEIAGTRAASAFETEDRWKRDEELREISATFERYRESDYGRKLYLIQSSIFGVDIQPVACQIAKLRFFISLAIEQQPTGDPNTNYGIQPLPNLETRFVAANTLLGLDEKALQIPLGGQNRVTELNGQLRENREQHFHAGNRQEKLRLRRQDARLRRTLGAELERAGMSKSDAGKIASWDPYDQNAHAEWFDAGYMFGVSNGFDVTIGNPPYVRAETSDKMPNYQKLRKNIISSKYYDTLWEKWDLFIPFMERSYSLLAPYGFTTLIVSDAFCHARYALKSREYFLRHSRIINLDFLSRIQIFDAGVHNITYLFQKANGKNNRPRRRVHFPDLGTVTSLTTNEQRHLTDRAFFPEESTFEDFPSPTILLSNICYSGYGLRPSSKPGSKYKFTTSDVTSERPDEVHSKPFVEGKHLDSWLPKTNLWLEYGTSRAPSEFYAPTFPELYEVDEKILAVRSPGTTPKASYDNRRLVFTASSVGFVLWHDLKGTRNRSIQKQARYLDEKQIGLPNREELESISQRFTVKYLVGVLNSSIAHTFLRAHRRSNIHIYPDDWKRLPIPDVSLAEQQNIVDVVDQILCLKEAESSVDTTVQEGEIDRLVNDLYGLTVQEVGAVADQIR